MDVQRALEFVQRLDEALSANRAYYDQQGDYWDRPEWKSTEEEIRRQLFAVRAIAAEVHPDVLNRFLEKPSQYGWTWEEVKHGLDELSGALQSREQVEELLAPRGPQLKADALHPVVWQAAARLWDQGNRRLALQTAATMLDAHLQGKLGVVRPSGYDLVTLAFNPNAKSSSKVLRFRQYPEGSEDWTSAHQGAMAFGQGCMLAIRNLATHRVDEPDPQLALEQLAALSVLARWIDDAEVVIAP